MWDNRLTELLNIEFPIIQAPMAGGVTTTELVASVSNAGGLGMVGAGYMEPGQLRSQIREIKKLTDKPYGVNLFIPGDFRVSKFDLDLAFDRLQPFRDELNIKEEVPVVPDSKEEHVKFAQLLDVIIGEKVPVCSFTFGIPAEEVISKLKSEGVILIGTATSVNEAVMNENAGMDIVVGQGSEAGGHRGTFSEDGGDHLLGVMSLIPQITEKVSIPVIAAGGIMNGKGVIASLCLGANGVQMGTAFLTCKESGAHKVYKEAVLKAADSDTVLTRAFSGKWARGIKNQFIKDIEEGQAPIPDYPVQNKLTTKIRKAAASRNDSRFMSLWSGQSPGLAKDQTVKELIREIVSQAEEIKASL
ncbi:MULTISPECIES: NAD(P)H-dependent flavin oxidoreductase [Mesobacillus]|uniref:NAD(P)H-dependent flavin oxidoreductase n=1 Tax=Mesobacillus TaxID=2675231 RepID=UPI001784D340|nr:MULTISPECIES: nitronate monooxygenase [Mesobacillus]MCM3573218.1 nitronate monooxygenase [Mesobacillus subterraneus]UYZ23159.1 nitronate monooxygenase [Mesobacillus jeotgali]